MAQKIQTLFIDDLDGSAAEGTVRFGLDGTEYEIDLNEEHAKALRDALARYVSAARRPSGAARRSARNGRRVPATGLNTTEVREWAKAQGIEVKDRGRVPAELVVKFKAATGQQDPDITRPARMRHPIRASLEHLNGMPELVVPRLLAAAAGILLMEDLGPGPSLADSLLTGDRSRVRADLVSYAEAPGSMHAWAGRGTPPWPDAVARARTPSLARPSRWAWPP